MVRVVGKEGALGAGAGENCSSGMTDSQKITRRYPGRGSVYYFGNISHRLGCAHFPRRIGAFNIWPLAAQYLELEPEI